jgi:hypothetical protein
LPRATFSGGAAVIMARKRKTAQKRLRQAIELSGPRLRDLLPKTDYSDNQRREIGANLALTLTDHARDAPLRLAFEAFQLDPSNPHDWRILLDDLSRVLFERPASNPRGARPKWDFELFDRHVEWARARTKKYLSRGGEPGPTHDDVALYLKIALPHLYGRFFQETLRTYIIKRQGKEVK